MEERLDDQREVGYVEHVRSPSQERKWGRQHGNYLEQYIYLPDHDAIPETFQDSNIENCLPPIDEDQWLVHLEDMKTAYKKYGNGDSESKKLLDDYLENPDTQGNPKGFIDGFLYKWNEEVSLSIVSEKNPVEQASKAKVKHKSPDDRGIGQSLLFRWAARQEDETEQSSLVQEAKEA